MSVLFVFIKKIREKKKKKKKKMWILNFIYFNCIKHSNTFYRLKIIEIKTIEIKIEFYYKCLGSWVKCYKVNEISKDQTYMHKKNAIYELDYLRF